jgi:lysozyme family protein
MPGVNLTDSLRKEYEHLFNTCLVRPDQLGTVESLIKGLLLHRARYGNVAGDLGIPWSFIAVIHNMESSQNFSRHLHNGDPLTGRTVQVPPGRPKKGSPPFTWEQSAADALTMKGLGAGTDWSLAGTLYQVERYNGWGYRLHHQHVLSPYLWSFSNQYTSGKYVADGTWSDTAVSKQCGAAVLLRRMAETGQIEFPDQPPPGDTSRPLISYSKSRSSDPAIADRAAELQRWLNTFPGIFVKVDGIPGEHTSTAYKKVTGVYLPGDPRG